MARTTKAEREATMRTLAGEQHCATHDRWFAQGARCMLCVVKDAPGKLIGMFADHALNGKPIDQQELLLNAGATVLQLLAMAQASPTKPSHGTPLPKSRRRQRRARTDTRRRKRAR